MSELEERFREDEQNTVACVFCDYKDIAATTPLYLMSSLVSQILDRPTEMPENVVKLYEKHQRNASRPSLDELFDLLQQLGKARSMYIIVDALDECSDNDNGRNILLQQLSRLRCGCNILMTSRSSVSISEHFDDYQSIEITAKESDIEKYISGHLSGRLEAHIKRKPELYDEIRSAVIQRAQKM